MVQEIFSHQKFESKSILISFLLYLILLQLPQKITNERGENMNSESPTNNHNHDNTHLKPHICLLAELTWLLNCYLAIKMVDLIGDYGILDHLCLLQGPLCHLHPPVVVAVTSRLIFLFFLLNLLNNCTIKKNVMMNL